jgi:PAS domain-containing protein
VLGAGDSQPLRLDAARLVAVRSATSAQIAADVSNRIVAVSGAVEELLGWPPDELEGRRLVTIIPPACATGTSPGSPGTWSTAASASWATTSSFRRCAATGRR